ncbi:hypothetical protein LAZ67_12001673, partial [Cordylochernes scorpioides]
MPKYVLDLAPSESPSEPKILSSKIQVSPEKSAKIGFQKKTSKESQDISKHANLPAGEENANSAAADGIVAKPSANGAEKAAKNWADRMEEEEKNEDGYTVVRNKKRHRDSGLGDTTTTQTSRATSTAPRRRTTGTRLPQVQEIRATRAHIADARVRQAFSTQEQCAYFEYCPDFSPYQYLQSVDKVVGGPKNIIQLTRMNGHVLVGLTTKAFAGRLIDGGLEIERTTLRTFPFRKRVEKIIIGNLPFFVEDATIIEALRPYGRVTSIAPMQLKSHRRANFPMLARQTTGARKASTSSPTDAKSPTAPQQPRQPAPAPAAPGLPTPRGVMPIEALAGPYSTAPQPALPAPPAQPAIVAPPPSLPAPRTFELETAPMTIEMMDVENRGEENTGSSIASQRSVIRPELDNFLEKAPSSLYAETDQLGLDREEILRALASKTEIDKLMPKLTAAQNAAITRLTDLILEKRPGSPPLCTSASGRPSCHLEERQNELSHRHNQRALYFVISSGNTSFGLLDLSTQMRVACIKGVKTALRGGLSAYSWLSKSGAWLTPLPPGTWLPARPRRLLGVWEAASEILALNHRVLPPNQLSGLTIIGGCRFLRPPDLLVASQWVGARVGDLIGHGSPLLRVTHAALAYEATLCLLAQLCRRGFRASRNGYALPATDHPHRPPHVRAPTPGLSTLHGSPTSACPSPSSPRRMVETRSGKMQDPAQERIQAEESAKPQPGATIGRDASSDPVVLNPNIDIPKYDGTEDPRPWIESLEEIGFLYHWADYIISRYAAMNMTGSAKTWLNLHKASFTSWENIKIRLIQDFSLDANKEELRMKLNRMQHWNEPAIRFAEDILVLCNKVDPAMEEETKIEHVIGGLKKEYSFALYLNPPKTTDDLLVVCKKMDSFEKKYRERVEKSRNLYNGPRYSRPQQQSRYVPPTAARNYQTTSRPQAPVSNNYKNDSPPTPRQYRNNFPQPSTPRRPYNPNFVPKPNLQRNTYNKSQEVSKNRTEDGRPICFKCNKPGHVARYCRVKFIRILEEDPADTQEKVEEKCQMNEISEKSGPRLYADEQKELKQVLERYGDLFSSRLGRTNLAKHRIDTEDAKPIKHKPYRVSAKERDIIKEQIDEMLTEGIIRPSSSPWSFPVILVKKRDGKYRFCVDYRKLNNVTVKDVYPIPRIDEVMDTLQGSTHFSAIDLRSGYWQVEVEERDKEKTAFTTAHGLYEFNVMPFGLCNASATFERNMENMLGNLRWQICLCYLDDVIIYSPDFPTHLKRLEAVFRCFRESNLRLNDKKCRFVFEELEILGYITSKHGIKPAEHNIKAIRNFPRPTKVKEVQSFLGMCSYYRKFIKDFSKIADPLSNLIKKSVSFTWTERQEEAFQTLKTALLSPPILGHFNPNAPTYIHTDASNIGIGATLVQDIGGEEKVISYLSRTLSKAEQNYSTTEKECLAVVWSMSKLRPYLYGRHFKIVTDHHALCWLKNLKDPTGRLARWALKIQEYDFDIIHKSGKKHLDADGLSRGPLPETDWDEDFERLFLNQITDEEDKFIESVKKNLNGSRRSIAQNFKEEDGCLFKKNPNPEGRAWLLVVPEKKKREIMKEYHNHMSNGHLGVARTMYRIKSKYFWPSMLKDVSEFVKTCHLCQSRKGSNQLPSGLLQPIPPANFPFERNGIDFVGPLPSTKNRKKWIIVLTDYYTRYAETRAVSEATVKEVSKFLVEDIFLRHGAPQYLISDRGSQFTSNLMKEVMKTCKIKHCFTTSYHPQTNGLTERLNRTLINMLSMYVNTDQKNWDEILPFITHAYNTTIQETTGYSPFFLMFGREPTSLLDDRNISVDMDKDDYDEYIKHHLDKINRTRKLVINNTIKTQERMKKNYDKKHMERSYEPGELVAVWTPIRKIGKCEKLLRKYFGPYRILKKLSNVNYLIEPKDNPGQDPLIVHASRIKPYFERIDEVNHEDVTTSGEGEVMVETRSGKMQDPAQERIQAEESAKPQPGATIYINIYIYVISWDLWDQCYLMLDDPRCQLYRAVVVEGDTAGPKLAFSPARCLLGAQCRRCRAAGPSRPSPSSASGLSPGVLHRLSGVAVNFKKSCGLWCGSWKHRTDSPLGISWTSESLTVLGCTITTRNTVASQASHLMGLLERAIARWSPFTRGLSLVGRARAANSLVLGSILHHLHGYLPPETTIGRLQARLARFVWGTSRVSWLPGRILARPDSDGGVGLLDIAGQLRLACLKGVQASLRGAANGYSWLVRSRAWLTPPAPYVWHSPRRRRLLSLWEAASSVLELDHRVLHPASLRSLRLRGDNRFLRPPDLLASERWLQATVGDFSDGAPALARSTRAALLDAQHLGAFCQRLLRENASSSYHAEYEAETIVLRGSATPITRLPSQRARRALDSARLQAFPTAELAARWTPTVDVPRSIPWADLRRNCFSGHDADVALRLALHALPHPASRRANCAACGSSDGSLAHRYWSCRAVRPLLREVFASCEVPLDLQAWLFGVGLHPEAVKLTSVAKATVYKYHLGLEL